MVEAPLYQRIRAGIEGQIMSGALQPGERIPFEYELMELYGCSRMTVNKALSALAAAGLISRHKRRGSFVMQPRIHMAALEIPDIGDEIEKRGHAYRLELIDRAVLDAEAADGAVMRIPDKGELLRVQCLHLADGHPYAVEDRLISLSAVPRARDADFATTPPGSWLLAHVPWTEAEHRISAAVAGEQAELLRVPAEKPCLALERWTWREGESITYVRMVFHGDKFDLTARFGN